MKTIPTLSDRKILLIVIIILASFLFSAKAQNANDSTIKISNSAIDHKLNVEFRADKLIYNLLVLISDSMGRTVFLDNQYQFKGLYKKTFDFETLEKGIYDLCIKKDEERINKKIIIQ